MKKLFYGVLMLATMVSCSKVESIDSGDVKNAEAATPKASMARSAVAADPYDGLLLNIKNIESNKYLRFSTLNPSLVESYSCLYSDKNAPNSRWYLRLQSDGSYVMESENSLSVTRNVGPVPTLFKLNTMTIIPNSSILNPLPIKADIEVPYADKVGQKWVIEDIPYSKYKSFKAKELPKNYKYPSRLYIEAGMGATYLVMNNKNENNPSQQWEISAVGDFDLVSIRYFLEPDDVVVPLQMRNESLLVTNNLSLPQTKVFTYTIERVESSSFFEETTITKNLGASFTVGVPIFNGSVNASLTTSKKWTYGTSESEKISETHSFTTDIPAHTTAESKLVIISYEISTGYEATLRSRLNGKITTVRGKWKGIQATHTTWELNDLTTGTPIERRSL